MTLRVTIEIVPFGEERRAREIYRFDIFNKGRGPMLTRYGVIEMDVEGGTAAMWDGEVRHRRESGAIELVRRILNKWARL